MREVNMTEGEDPGKKQLEFAKVASKAANQNLTDFFEMWGSSNLSIRLSNSMEHTNTM